MVILSFMCRLQGTGGFQGKGPTPLCSTCCWSQFLRYRFCPLELYNMLQRSLWVKPCVKEVCGPTKTLTTRVIPMKTVALATEEQRGKKGFSVYPVENPSPVHADSRNDGYIPKCRFVLMS